MPAVRKVPAHGRAWPRACAVRAWALMAAAASACSACSAATHLERQAIELVVDEARRLLLWEADRDALTILVHPARGVQRGSSRPISRCRPRCRCQAADAAASDAAAAAAAGLLLPLPLLVLRPVARSPAHATRCLPCTCEARCRCCAHLKPSYGRAVGRVRTNTLTCDARPILPGSTGCRQVAWLCSLVTSASVERQRAPALMPARRSTLTVCSALDGGGGSGLPVLCRGARVTNTVPPCPCPLQEVPLGCGGRVTCRAAGGDQGRETTVKPSRLAIVEVTELLIISSTHRQARAAAQAAGEHGLQPLDTTPRALGETKVRPKQNWTGLDN